MIGGQVGMQFQTGGRCGLMWSYIVCVWVQYCGRELVPIHTGGKGATGFSNVESISFSAL